MQQPHVDQFSNDKFRRKKNQKSDNSIFKFDETKRRPQTDDQLINFF